MQSVLLVAILPTVAAVAPAPPHHVVASMGPGAGQIKLDWNPPLDPASPAPTEYRVYRSSVSGGVFSLVKTLTPEADAFSDNFNDNSMNTQQWAEGHFKDGSNTWVESAAEPDVVQETNGELQLKFGSGNGYWPVAGLKGTQVDGMTVRFKAKSPDLIYQHYDVGVSNEGRLVDTVADGKLIDITGQLSTNYQNFLLSVSSTGDIRLYKGEEEIYAGSYSGAKWIYWAIRQDWSGGNGMGFYLDDVIVSKPLSWTDSGLPNAATYYYKVKAVNADGVGPYSAEVSASTPAVPTAPLNLGAAKGPGGSEIGLSWNPPADASQLPVTSYKIYRATTSAGPFDPVGTLSGGGFNDSFGNNQMDTTKWAVGYHYNDDPISWGSDGDGTVAEKNKEIRMDGAWATQVHLGLKVQVSDRVVNFAAKRGPSSGGQSFLIHFSAANQFTDESTYGPSVDFTGQLTESYKNFRLEFSGDSIKLYDDSANSLVASTSLAGVKWLFFRVGNQDRTLYLDNVCVADCHWTNTGLPAATTYYYKVSAVTGAGEGAQSSAASATTHDLPTQPMNLQASRGTNGGEIDLSWSAPQDTDGLPVKYSEIYRSNSNLGPFDHVGTSGLKDVFDDGIVGGGLWSSISGANENGDCGSFSGSNALKFDGSGRTAQTVNLDVSETQTVTFYLKIANGAGSCEKPETGEGVVFEYSTNSGSSWTTLGTYSPGSYSSFTRVDVTLSAAARTDATRFRWRQTGSFSNPGDNWALDDVKILADQRSWTDKGLQAGTQYFFKVSAVTSAGEGEQSEQASATTHKVPTAPLNLAATRGHVRGQIDLTWGAPQDTDGLTVTSYKVYRSTAAGGPFDTSVATVTATSWTNGGLPDNTTYYYKVSAVTSAGEGTKSGSSSATTPAEPGQPRSLGYSMGPNPGQITVRWDAPADDGGLPISKYTIYRSATPSGTYSLVGSAGGSARSYVDSGLLESTFYYYRVSATNVIDEGPQSEWVKARTPGRPTEPLNVTTIQNNPNAPVGEITLAWDPPETDGGLPITKYEVYRRRMDSPNWVSIGYTISGSQHSYVDRTFDAAALDYASLFYYYVTAANAVGEGPKSEEAYGVPLYQAGTPMVDDLYDLAWDLLNGGPVDFCIETQLDDTAGDVHVCYGLPR